MSDCKKRVELMEKEIVYLKGNERILARRDYIELLKSCKECRLEDPIYIKRR